MSGLRLFQIGAALVVFLVIWSFLDPKNPPEHVAQFEPSQDREVELESNHPVNSPAGNTPVEQVLSLDELSSEEAQLLAQERALMQQVALAPSAPVEAQIEVAQPEVAAPETVETHIVEEASVQIATEEPREEDVVERASLKLTVEKKSTPQAAQEVIPSKKLQETPVVDKKPDAIFRKVYYYNDNFDVETTPLEIELPKKRRVATRQPKETEKVMAHEENVEPSSFRGRMKPSYAQQDNVQNDNIEAELWRMERKIASLEREHLRSRQDMLPREKQDVAVVSSHSTDLTNVAPFSRTAVVTFDGLPLRLSPSLLDSKIRKLSKGEYLQVQYGQDGWFRVQTSSGIVAWVEEAGIQLR